MRNWKEFTIWSMCAITLFVLSACGGPVSLPRSMVDPSYIPPPTKAEAMKYGAVGDSIIPSPVTPDQNTMVQFSSDKTAMMALIQATLQNRDKMKAKAAEKPKIDMEFAMVDLGNGAKAYMPTHIKSFDQPTFDGTPVKQDVPENEAYATAKSMFHDLAMFSVIGIGIDKFTGMVGKLATGGATTYNGPVVETQSRNTTGGNAGFDGSGSAYHIGDEATSTQVVPAEAATAEVVTP